MSITTIILLFAYAIHSQIYEKLTQSEEFITVQIGYAKQLLFLPLRSILVEENIDSVELRMGHLCHKQLPQCLSHQGISIMVVNKTQITDRFAHLLTSIFSVSTQKNYWYYYRWLNFTIISDPNDRFCTNNIDEVVTNLLPCGGKSGIGQLIKGNKLLTSKYVGLSIIWTNNKILFKFTIEKQPEFINLQKFKYRKCSQVDYAHFNILKGQIVNKTVIIDQLTPPSVIQNENKNIFSIFSNSRWYSRNKCLIVNIHLNESNDLNSITLAYRFSKGFIIRPDTAKLIVNSESLSTELVKISNNLRQIYIKLDTKSTLSPLNINLKVQYTSNFIGFEQYKVISGGGEQQIKLPIILHYHNNNMSVVFPENIYAEKLIEPDFSIPFHGTTFTIAIFGYLWLSFWRTFIE